MQKIWKFLLSVNNQRINFWMKRDQSKSADKNWGKGLRTDLTDHPEDLENSFSVHII